jgi:hypothetical protein
MHSDDLAAGADQDDGRLAVRGVGEHVGALGQQRGGGEFAAIDGRQRLAGADDRRRPFL